MNDSEMAAREWERALERLAVDVTTTAYAIALRHGAGGSWLDLQLRLWKALARTVREWGRYPGPPAEGLPPLVAETAAPRPARSSNKNGSKR